MEHNSVIGCLNKSYLEGRKNEMELKTSIKKAVVTQLEYFIFFVVCTVVMCLPVFRHDYTTLVLPCLVSVLWEMMHVQQTNTKT